MSSIIPAPADLVAPTRFTQDTLDWVPWVEPLPIDDVTDHHYEARIQRSRVKNPYFRLLVRDPDILRERTKTDLDIFLNTDAGLPRAERELAATAASRVNGCVYCASVHSAFTTQYSGRREDVQRLLDEGVSPRIDPRWDAIVDATVALTATPAAFGADEIAGLEAAGLDDLEVLDTILSGAFFNWANRLMLSIGEPGVPPTE